ncbi:hypothetical protein [Roseateles agri]|uniref:hypothetical protein n=1 Tax=Roseateles agri TaxID=3098619 RepID=UPI002A5A8074|nr:hypothetical protein [Paucibacter sp. R3-3]
MLNLRSGKATEEDYGKLRQEMAGLSGGDSPLPPGVQKLLTELSTTVGKDASPEDKDQRQVVEDFRDELQGLLNRLVPVLKPDEVALHKAWLELSAKSCELNKYELAMKVLQDAWHQAKAIEAEKREPAVVLHIDSPLRPVVDRALEEVGKVAAQLDELDADLAVQFALLASMTHKAMKAGEYGVALGLASQWFTSAEEAVAAQGRQRMVPLRQRIEDEVYIPNAELKKLEAPLASVPHSDKWFNESSVSKAEWDGVLQGVVQDGKTVQAAVTQARQACEQERLRWGQEKQGATVLLTRLKLVVSDAAGADEDKRFQSADASDIATQGLRKLGDGCTAWQTLAAEWERAAQASEAARDAFAQSEEDTKKKLLAVTREAPADRAPLDLLLAAGQQLAAGRDWVAAGAKLEECRRTADEKIKAQRDGVKLSVGTHCEAAYLEDLLDKLGAAEVKKLSTALGPKVLGEMSLQFKVGEMEQLQKEAGDGKGLKALLDDVAGGKAADLQSLRASFGSLAPLQAVAKDGFGGKTKTLGTLLKTGFAGDSGKLKTFLDGYPNPDPDLLKANNPAALKAQKDQENLKNLLNTGGLNDNPEAFAHLVNTGCAGDPAKLKDLHAKFSATTPPGLAGMKALLDTANLKTPPERLADILKTGCSSSAENLKELAIGFDGKMGQLKEATGQWGDGSGAAIKGLTDARHLNGDFQALQKNFTATLNQRYPGSGGKADREFMIRVAPEFTRAVLPDDINATLADKFELDPADAGSFKDSDWNHLLMHVCERHLPSSFAFEGAKAASTPINVHNSQFPVDWTPQRIATLMKEALKSANGKQTLLGLEDRARKAEEYAKHVEWAARTIAHDCWQARVDYRAWWNGGGRQRWIYDKKMEKGEVWNGPVPPDPGPAPPWPGQGFDNPGPEPAQPGAEPPNTPEPPWITPTFWYGDVEFQLGVDYRNGKRQIVQYFPVQSVGTPAITAFPRYDMEAMRDATIK